MLGVMITVFLFILLPTGAVGLMAKIKSGKTLLKIAGSGLLGAILIVVFTITLENMGVQLSESATTPLMTAIGGLFALSFVVGMFGVFRIFSSRFSQKQTSDDQQN